MHSLFDVHSENANAFHTVFISIFYILITSSCVNINKPKFTLAGKPVVAVAA